MEQASWDIEEVLLQASFSRKALEGFRFKNSEEALAYGSHIQRDTKKINELVSELKHIVRQNKNLSDQSRMVLLTKVQLLREAISAAKQ